MTTENTTTGVVKGFGNNPLVAACRFTPSGSATQTLTHSFGILSVTRTGAGAWTVQLAPELRGAPFFPRIEVVEDDTTNYHWVDVTTITESTGQFTCRHRTQVYASVASAPTASDTVDQIQIFVFGVRQ